jgi:hypothetical protein
MGCHPNAEAEGLFISGTLSIEDSLSGIYRGNTVPARLFGRVQG